MFRYYTHGIQIDNAILYVCIYIYLFSYIFIYIYTTMLVVHSKGHPVCII